MLLGKEVKHINVIGGMRRSSAFLYTLCPFQYRASPHCLVKLVIVLTVKNTPQIPIKKGRAGLPR